MFKWLFGSKKEVSHVKEETKKAFSSVKEDVKNISKWIKHLNEADSKLDFRISGVNDKLSSIEIEIENLKNFLNVSKRGNFKQVFKTQTAVQDKQTAVGGVQTAVQTAVQTGEIAENLLGGLSFMERALVLVLLNTEMRLSYEDLSTMLGKSRATIRGQINSIKQKSEGLIEEILEKNGKKRVFMPDEMKELLLKDAKVRVRDRKKSKKEEAE